MDILFSRVFWGVIVLLIGLSIILGAFFKINFPFFRVVISLILIYFGFQMLIGAFTNRGSWGSNDSVAVFSGAQHAPNNEDLRREYSAIFGSQIINLSQLRLNEDHNVEVNAIFGSAKIMVSKQQPFRIKGSAAFGSVKMPNGGETVFGDQNMSNTEGDAPGTLWIDANAVFGGVEIFVVD